MWGPLELPALPFFFRCRDKPEELLLYQSHSDTVTLPSFISISPTRGLASFAVDLSLSLPGYKVRGNRRCHANNSFVVVSLLQTRPRL